MTRTFDPASPTRNLAVYKADGWRIGPWAWPISDQAGRGTSEGGYKSGRKQYELKESCHGEFLWPNLAEVTVTMN